MPEEVLVTMANGASTPALLLCSSIECYLLKGELHVCGPGQEQFPPLAQAFGARRAVGSNGCKICRTGIESMCVARGFRAPSGWQPCDQIGVC